jgi:hypothetical protein
MEASKTDGDNLKFGLAYNTAYYGTDPGLMAAAARCAENCGFESFYVPEHIVLYPGATAYSMPLPPDLAVADPLACLAYVAAATSTLLLGTGVLLLPYHHPVVLAKQLATIDVLSRGRMSLLTIGLGTLPARLRRRVSNSGPGDSELMRRSTCSACCGAGTQRASATRASSSPSPRPAASPSRMTDVSCLFTSADRAALPLGGQAVGAMATSQAADSRWNSVPSSSP